VDTLAERIPSEWSILQGANYKDELGSINRTVYPTGCNIDLEMVSQLMIIRNVYQKGVQKRNPLFSY